MQVLNFNTGINFGRQGNLKEFSPVGFSATPDDISTWSQAGMAELSFRVPPLRHDVRFAIEVFPFLADGAIPQQGCFVYLNGLFVYYRSVKTPVELMFTVARDLINPRANRLSFALPNATSPSELQRGDDLRQLGLSFVKLTAGPPAAPAPQQTEGGATQGDSRVDKPAEDRNRPMANPAARFSARDNTAPPAAPAPQQTEVGTTQGDGRVDKPAEDRSRPMANPAARFGARDNTAPARPEPSKNRR